MMDSFKLLTGSTEGWFIMLMAFLFLLTLFGNMISWSLGVNNTACYAENGDMPKFLKNVVRKMTCQLGRFDEWHCGIGGHCISTNFT